ncbi:MAG: hypothetical protein E7J31_05140 [Clostridium sp.]|uniref:hypothetical protein n=1 Tax=Clostridium sp. TaxID=1506 RepID=UPI0029087FC1|nr:hypothetical protein [Clostridium sp.]MDU7947803.1 hypothetical protein [Clostridium sp.]
MEFITVEQFKEQPKEVQKVFLDWWKPSVGDIFIFNTDEYDNSDSNIGVLGSIKQINITRRSKGKYRIPLFTEGQLRKFIEDKTGGKVDASFNGETYTVYSNEDFGLIIKMYEDIDSDLLQAYWKVACMVAKEGLNG